LKYYIVLLLIQHNLQLRKFHKLYKIINPEAVYFACYVYDTTLPS